MSVPYGRQSISESDISAVVDVLRSSHLTQGPVVPRFENALSDLTSSHFCTVFNSATSALHAACMALGVGPGDTVWTSPTTFVASANCALYCGANIDFVDINPATGLLCVDHLQRKLQSASASNSLPKAIIPVHLSGSI